MKLIQNITTPWIGAMEKLKAIRPRSDFDYDGKRFVVLSAKICRQDDSAVLTTVSEQIQ